MNSRAAQTGTRTIWQEPARLFRRVALIAAGIFGGLAALILAGFLLLNIDSLRNSVIATAVEAMNGAGTELHIARMSGEGLDDIVFEDVSLANADGVWLTLKRLELDWSPLSLLRGEVHVRRLTMDGVSVARSPAATKDEQDTKLVLPAPPIAIRLGELKIANLQLGGGLISPQHASPLALLDAHGRGRWNRRHLDIELAVKRQDTIPGHIDLSLLHDIGGKNFRLSLELEDGAEGKPGLIAQLMQLDDADRVIARAKGANDKGVLNAALKVDGGRAITVDATAKGNWQAALDIVLAVKAEGSLVSRPLKSVNGADRLELQTGIFLDRADTLSLSDLTLQTGALKLTGSAQYGSLSSSGRHQARGAGSIQGLASLAGERGDALPDAMQWRLEAIADDRTQKTRIDRLTLTAPEGIAEFSGDASFDGQISGKALLALADARPLGAFLEQDVQGEIEMSLDPLTRDERGTIAANINVQASNMSFSDDTFHRLLGGSLTATGSLLAMEDGGFAVSSLKVLPQSSAYRLEADITMPAHGALKGGAVFSAKETAALFPDMASGALQAKADFSGTSSKPRIAVQARLSNGSLYGLDATSAELDVVAARGNTGPLSFNLKGRQGDISLQATMGLPDQGGVTLGAIKGNIFGGNLEGDISVSGDGLADGAIKGTGLPLKPFSTLAGVELGGRADITLDMNNRQGKQNVRLTANMPQLQTKIISAVRLGDVLIQAELQDAFNDAQVNATLTAPSGRGGFTILEKVQAAATGPLSNLSLSAEATGSREAVRKEDFSFVFAGRLQAGSTSILALEKLRLSVGPSALTLADPAKINLSPDVKVQKITFDITGPSERGTATASVTLGERRLNLNGILQNVPLELLPMVLPVEQARGTASGKLELDSARGTGTITLDLAKVSLSESDELNQGEFNARINGSWRQGRFQMAANASHTGRREGGTEQPFRLEASLPVIRDPQGAWPMLAKSGKVQGNMSWKGEASSLMALTGIYTQRIAGEGSISLSAAGDISNPRIEGIATLKNGTYENFDSGTLLKQLSLDLKGRNSDTLEFSLTANDNRQGKVKANGTISVSKQTAKAIAIGVDFDNTRIMQRRDIDLAVRGRLDIEGTKLPPSAEAPLLVKGTLTTSSATLHIPESLPPSVAQIDVTEINGPMKREVEGEAEPLPVNLDIAVSIPGGSPMRVTGRGIESLWQGNVAVTGSLAAPRLSGNLERRRGTFDFAGKSFALTTGTIRFLGETPIDPELNLVLTYQRTGFSSSINVRGPGSRPDVVLSSTPALPRDEIMSRILFNRAPGELSALEAAQLANTLAQLSGHGLTGGGILDKVQQSLGLDVLSVGTSAAGNTTLNAGKYIREGVYVGVEQGAMSSDSSVKVEVEITSNISVESHIGNNADSDIGVNWKWDY